jgi:hypothetical protein
MSGGGKSRKSGGVSKKLIDALKSGKYSETKKGCGGKSKNEDKVRGKSLFEDDGETKD